MSMMLSILCLQCVLCSCRHSVSLWLW